MPNKVTAWYVYSGVSFAFFPFFLLFFAHFLIFLQNPFLLPSFPFPPCVSVLLPLTAIFSSISQSPLFLFSFLLFSAFPPLSIFFLNILYPSFPHFLLYIFHFLFFFLSSLLRPYFPSSFISLFIHFLCHLSSVQIPRFLSRPTNCFPSCLSSRTPCTHDDTWPADSQSVRCQCKILGPWALLSLAATRWPRNCKCAQTSAKPVRRMT